MAFSIFGLGKRDHNAKNEVVEIPLDQIEPNRYQPRQVFDEDGIRELAETIDAHGLLQPIILREYEPAKYEIIAGERRYRAMKLLGWDKSPAIVEKMNDHETASLALIENLQRSQLSPVEEAQAYKRLMDLNHLTQANLAKGMGKSQSAIANKLRLLKLIAPVQNGILDGLITERHGRALLGLNEDQQRKMLMRIVNEKLNVRQTEDEVARLQGKPISSEVEEKREKERIAKEEHPQTVAPAKKARKKFTAKKGNKKTSKDTSDKNTKIVVSDPRIAMNTIKESVQMIRNGGLDAKVSEQTLKNSYKITIKIPKTK